MNEEFKKVFLKGQRFIYQNARPLDLMLFRFHFAGGNIKDVLDVLEYYQNEDGGFGHGIEPDFLNPNSSPMATWAATEIIKSIGLKDKMNSIVKGIIKYLMTKEHFINGFFANTIPSNDLYPHAVWWGYSEQIDVNPTAALAAFLIDYSDIDSVEYVFGVEIAKNCYNHFMNNDNKDFGSHSLATLACMYKTLDANKINQYFDLNSFKEKLIAATKRELNVNPEDWKTEYIAKPSDFFNAKDDFLYHANKDIAGKEIEYIINNQKLDGSFDVNWQWYNDYKEFEVSKNFWKSNFIIKNLLFLKNML